MYCVQHSHKHAKILIHVSAGYSYRKNLPSVSRMVPAVASSALRPATSASGVSEPWEGSAQAQRPLSWLIPALWCRPPSCSCRSPCPLRTAAALQWLVISWSEAWGRSAFWAPTLRCWVSMAPRPRGDGRRGACAFWDFWVYLEFDVLVFVSQVNSTLKFPHLILGRHNLWLCIKSDFCYTAFFNSQSFKSKVGENSLNSSIIAIQSGKKEQEESIFFHLNLA